MLLNLRNLATVSRNGDISVSGDISVLGDVSVSGDVLDLIINLLISYALILTICQKIKYVTCYYFPFLSRFTMTPISPTLMLASLVHTQSSTTAFPNAEALPCVRYYGHYVEPQNAFRSNPRKFTILST